MATLMSAAHSLSAAHLLQALGAGPVPEEGELMDAEARYRAQEVQSPDFAPGPMDKEPMSLRELESKTQLHDKMKPTFDRLQHRLKMANIKDHRYTIENMSSNDGITIKRMKTDLLRAIKVFQDNTQRNRDKISHVYEAIGFLDKCEEIRKEHYDKLT